MRGWCTPKLAAKRSANFLPYYIVSNMYSYGFEFFLLQLPSLQYNIIQTQFRFTSDSLHIHFTFNSL
ncbi:hypothetical protein VN97_g2369 [Penicillium thymicola]|uniref:Uncharacterized protein n=1 Tax=Penicillium thymicola TaxID=293382 RepID=A0AAI9TP45_PENTH|nr:hypothetical protein VN97_g2369 [Penicillium thymicola]